MATADMSLFERKNFINKKAHEKKPVYYRIILFLLVLVLMSGSFNAQIKQGEKILARVGNKEITSKEFRQRSELTIRPDNFKDKYITLNNLISEKILAIEYEKKNNPELNVAFQSKLKGIKEQMMRDKLFNSEAFDKVVFDSSEIKNVYRNSLREYELEFYTISNDTIIKKIEETIKSAPELTNDLFNELQKIVGNKPLHKTKYLDPDDQILTETLYTTLRDTGEVVGPLRISNGDYILMRVNNWTDFPLISSEDRRERWNKVEEKMHQIEARKVWQQYITNLMRGKKLEFDFESFRTLSDVAFDYYSKNNQSDSLYNQLTDNPQFAPDIDVNAPFFTIDNKTWTVEEFKKELLVRPLVFRTKDLNKKNFDENFKFAIADMIRDYYVTGEAYKNSLDKSGDVVQTVNMWKDSFLSAQEERDVIDAALNSGLITENNNDAKLKFWENHLVTLQNKYTDSISVNIEEFNKIKLTEIDMMAIRPGVPYPVAVPKFPMLMSSNKLDYIKQWGNIKK